MSLACRWPKQKFWKTILGFWRHIKYRIFKAGLLWSFKSGSSFLVYPIVTKLRRAFRSKVVFKVSVHQIERVLGKFDTSKGSGPDGLANFFIKIGLPVIAESLCDILNLSLATGAFPDSVLPLSSRAVNRITVKITGLFLFCHF